MAYLAFDSSYAPCGFIIAPDGTDYHDDGAVLIHSDWDFPGVASSCGWGLALVQSPGYQDGNDGVPCEHDGTDGTVPCKECGLRPGDFISAAYDWLRERDGESFPELDEYLAAAE